MATILMVDDNEDQLLFFGTMLEKKGYHVIQTVHPGEVIEIIANKNIDLVILDIIMPEINGLELLEDIKLFEKDLPIIIHSNYIEYKNNFITWGAEDFIDKADGTKMLLHAVENVFKKNSISLT